MLDLRKKRPLGLLDSALEVCDLFADERRSAFWRSGQSEVAFGVWFGQILRCQRTEQIR